MKGQGKIVCKVAHHHYAPLRQLADDLHLRGAIDRSGLVAVQRCNQNETRHKCFESHTIAPLINAVEYRDNFFFL